ncbi:MAG: ATP-binding cassette domain-containing protein [Dehalococcoidia bacterium]|nr:ATP-binding cassette domain-containing protein [Dehalococcoidia bacterium]
MAEQVVNDNGVLLEVKHLTKHFPVTKGVILMKTTGWVKAVDDVNFVIKKGETFGLVGESGCGKTTTSRLILLLEKPTGGSITFRGKDIRQDLPRHELSAYRREVQAMFQDPTSSMDPRTRVRDVVSEPIRVNRVLPNNEVPSRVEELLHQVGLPASSASLYPHEFSGGQRQRIALARALSINPSLVVLDEPVSALDVSIQAQIMNLMRDLQEKLSLTYLLIAHNLAVVRHMSNRIGVMYLGKLVECADSDELYTRPLHPYTQALYLSALPSRPELRRQEFKLQGEVPSPINPPSGCRFHPRCSRAEAVCSEAEPELKQMGGDHQVACHMVR